jgi:hypothetical protein
MAAGLMLRNPRPLCLEVDKCPALSTAWFPGGHDAASNQKGTRIRALKREHCALIVVHDLATVAPVYGQYLEISASNCQITAILRCRTELL